MPILTGRPVDRHGYVQCPFHRGGNERTPSLRAYEDPDRGWKCFATGCDAGGDVYSLAARLAGRDRLEGREFVKTRYQLLDRLTPAQQPAPQRNRTPPAAGNDNERPQQDGLQPPPPADARAPHAQHDLAAAAAPHAPGGEASPTRARIYELDQQLAELAGQLRAPAIA
ncbi:MAG: hypothetical protein ABSG43_28745, partial [Solirubrobacteraceae bacterium]